MTETPSAGQRGWLSPAMGDATQETPALGRGGHTCAPHPTSTGQTPCPWDPLHLAQAPLVWLSTCVLHNKAAGATCIPRSREPPGPASRLVRPPLTHGRGLSPSTCRTRCCLQVKGIRTEWNRGNPVVLECGKVLPLRSGGSPCPLQRKLVNKSHFRSNTT